MNLATATVLAVLWAGAAAAADGLVGGYRDVGPRVDTPYDGRVPAWITRARISRVGPKRYSIRMSTGRPSGCIGEVTATGTLKGTAMIATASDGADCKLAITFERSTMRVREQGNCFNFRGMQCHFGGTLKRERSGG